MTCPKCHGKRTVPMDHYSTMVPGHQWFEPCPHCHGTGTVDCCDGDIAQPEEGS